MTLGDTTRRTHSVLKSKRSSMNAYRQHGYHTKVIRRASHLPNLIAELST